MADLTREEMQRLARLGAKARLEELRQEESSIRRAFPDLFRGRGRKAAAADASGFAAPRKRRRSNMSAAARKAVSERMKKYWAARRKEKKKEVRSTK